ncbi:MAG: serine/threonine-protein kinase, partial [Myxococcota bacterium]
MLAFAMHSRFFSRMVSDLPELQLGEHLHVGELIGSGGMGDVFRARDVRLEREVAVKFVRVGTSGDEAARALREARAMARLSHPNSVHVYEVGEHQGEPYLVMELVDGPSLAERLPLALPDASNTLLSVCAAVAEAHRQGFVHRDLKPENVLFDRTGSVKVTDYGLARRHDSTDWTITEADRVAGTPFFAAPESLRGVDPDPRADVYSLGVLFRAVLTGEPTGALDGQSKAIRRVIERATDPTPSKRYADASELASAIRGATLEDPVEHPSDLVPPEYQSYAAAASLAGTVASACVLWVLYLSFTPEWLPNEEIRPLVMLTHGPPTGGESLVLARFRIGPTLMAAVAVALMLAGYGVVRRYWRVTGIDKADPEHEVASSRTVLGLGAFQTAAYFVRLVFLDGFAIAAFVPVLGGLVELVTLWFFWATLLEIQRIQKPWRREWRLWLGLGLALIPPVLDMGRHIFSFL